MKGADLMPSWRLLIIIDNQISEHLQWYACMCTCVWLCMCVSFWNECDQCSRAQFLEGRCQTFAYWDYNVDRILAKISYIFLNNS